MTNVTLTFPGSMARARSRATAWLAGPNRRNILAGAAVCVLVLVIAVAWSLQSGFSGDADPKELRKLPARPEDIEKHGKLATTILPPDDARKRNAYVAFEPRVGANARPFAFTGSDVDRARAIQCLAAAVLYEAGDDATGQETVAQVVLNRVRHPAFPGTICGVVYQGAQRRRKAGITPIARSSRPCPPSRASAMRLVPDSKNRKFLAFPRHRRNCP